MINRGLSFARRGALGIIVVFLLLALLVPVGIYFRGSRLQNSFDRHLVEGYSHIESDRPIEAFRAFAAADGYFGFSLGFYQYLNGLSDGKFVSRSDLLELIVASGLLGSYESFFQLKPADDWLKILSDYEEAIASEGLQELQTVLRTAREVSKLCEQFQSGDYNAVMKGLLAAQKTAAPTDQDFFIQQVRMLIACGRAMNEVEIINHARELLWRYSYELEMQDPRIDALWGMLSG